MLCEWQNNMNCIKTDERGRNQVLLANDGTLSPRIAISE
jgi:hypothetical protein